MRANLDRYALIACLIHSVWSQGAAQLTFSSNPVYSKEPVTLTCYYGSAVTLISVTVEAFEAALPKGSLSCTSAPPDCADSGVLNGAKFNGWPVPFATASVNVTLTAMPSLELNYSCTARVANDSGVYTVASERTFLQVRVCPSTPNLLPSPVDFYDSDSGTIVCESRNGKPAALVSLTVSDPSGGIPVTRNGSDSARVDLLSPLSPLSPLSNWHNATVTCRVTNHNCSNISSTTGVVHVTFNTSVPNEVCTKESNVVLNCTAHIWSYAAFVYNWTIPAEANVTGRLDLESLTVLQGHSGSFNCTATNNYSMASVVIVFTVSNVCHTITTPISSPDYPPCGQCWIIGLVLGIIAVVITAVVGVLCKRGHFSKGRASTSASQKHHTDVCVSDRSNAATLHSVDREYDSLDTQRSSEPTYAQLILE